jgi:hypothetical protein
VQLGCLGLLQSADEGGQTADGSSSSSSSSSSSGGGGGGRFEACLAAARQAVQHASVQPTISRLQHQLAALQDAQVGRGGAGGGSGGGGGTGGGGRPHVMFTGGSITTAAAMQLGLQQYDSVAVHGTRVSARSLLALAEELGAPGAVDG